MPLEFGLDSEQALRLRILLMGLCCDPMAIVLVVPPGFPPTLTGPFSTVRVDGLRKLIPLWRNPRGAAGRLARCRSLSISGRPALTLSRLGSRKQTRRPGYKSRGHGLMANGRRSRPTMVLCVILSQLIDAASETTMRYFILVATLLLDGATVLLLLAATVRRTFVVVRCEIAQEASNPPSRAELRSRILDACA